MASNEKKQPRGMASVELRALTVSVGRRNLLRDVTIEIPAGKITLVVGCSGVGKSVLLRILSGAIGRHDQRITVTGQVLIRGQDILATRRQAPVGVVFQQFALFDDFSANDNVEFAAQHGKTSETGSAAGWLQELDVPSGTPISALSGGQQQRLAIARTLAASPDVVLYDEPTSGLDSLTARRVASLIQQTHSRHGQTSVIVTHDYHALPPIADRILILDPIAATLREVESQESEVIESCLKSPVNLETKTATNGTLVRRIGQRILDGLELTGRAAEGLAILPWSCLPIWKNVRWGCRYLRHYLNLVCGLSAAVYIGISGLIIGFVATYFTFKFLPYANYTRPLLIENLLSSIGFALYRILVPVLATLLIAARCGAAVASDIGAKCYARQFDAMRTFGVQPSRYLLTPVLYAFAVGTPLLTALSVCVACLTSLVVFVSSQTVHGAEFWYQHFQRDLVVPDQLLPRGTGWLVAKLLTCGLGIAAISFHSGARPKSSSADVSRGITQAILWSTLFVLVVHFSFTFFEFD